MTADEVRTGHTRAQAGETMRTGRTKGRAGHMRGVYMQTR